MNLKLLVLNKVKVLVTQSYLTLCMYPARFLCPWDSPGKNTGVDYHFLPQGNFPTQGSNLVSCIAVRFFTIWARREICIEQEYVLFKSF